MSSPLPEGPAPADFASLLARARAGCRDALGQLLESCRPYLLLVARETLREDLRAKVGASDLVQETCIDVQRDFGRFQGETEAEWLAWLRKVLHHNVLNLARHYDTEGRRVGREVSLDVSPGLKDQVPDPQSLPQPSGMAPEEEERLDRALAELPAPYREVLLLRCRDDLTFEEIGARLNRSADAARHLWSRAVECLQERMETPP